MSHMILQYFFCPEYVMIKYILDIGANWQRAGEGLQVNDILPRTFMKKTGDCHGKRNDRVRKTLQ